MKVELTTEKLMLADTPIRSISTTYNQHVRTNDFTQHNYGFILG
jgi:hypothetical protein